MPSFEVDFEVYCTCGNGLCNSTSEFKTKHGNNAIEIEPCPLCLKEAKKEAYDEGYEDGKYALNDDK
jgi:hypothetical protein